MLQVGERQTLLRRDSRCPWQSPFPREPPLAVPQSWVPPAPAAVPTSWAGKHLQTDSCTVQVLSRCGVGPGKDGKGFAPGEPLSRPAEPPRSRKGLSAAGSKHSASAAEPGTTIESCLLSMFLEVLRKTFILVVATVSFCFCFADRNSCFSETF